MGAFFVIDLASAHHSAIGFDQEQVVVVEGAVTRFEWTNPHVYLYVEDASGLEWLIETDSTPILTRSGWTPDLFAPGEIVTIRAHPDRISERAHMLLLSVEDQYGTIRSSLGRSRDNSALGSTASATSLDGIWRADPTTTRAMHAKFRNHPLTERGGAAKAAYEEWMNPGAECVPWSSPMNVSSRFYLRELELADDAILFRSEFYSAERTFYMDGRGHPADGQRTNQGHSIGRWEGDMLVVDTRLFADHRSPMGSSGVPSGAQRHLIERFTLSEDGTRVFVDVVLEDPAYLAEPFTTQIVWVYSPHLEMLRFDCDPEVARRFAQ